MQHTMPVIVERRLLPNKANSVRTSADTTICAAPGCLKARTPSSRRAERQARRTPTYVATPAYCRRAAHCALAHETAYARFNGRVHHIWTGDRHIRLATLGRE